MDLRTRFALWTAVVAVAGGAFAYALHGGLPVETDILAMLPAADRDPVVEQSARRLADATGRRTLFLVGARGLADARAAAQAFALSLRTAGVFADVTLEVEAGAAELDALYAPHRASLLSDRQRRALLERGAESLAEDARRALYTPSGWLRARPFSQDPLNLYGDFLSQLVPARGSLRLQDGVLVAEGDGKTWVMLTATTQDSPFSASVQDAAVPAIAAAALKAGAHSDDVEVLRSGVLLHADANRQRAEREIRTFGGLSLAGVVLLILLTFRELRSLLLTLLSLGTGVMAALTACVLLFEKIHVVTLVFGSTLIGVTVDYSIHYFADQFRHRDRWDPRLTLRHVGPGILIGMITTVIGYQAFLLPPFPGLRQIATFSIAGITTACCCVLLWYPLLANREPARHTPLMLKLARQLSSMRVRISPRAAAGSALATAAVVGSGLWLLEFEDSIRALQSAPAALQQEDARVRALLGELQDTRFYLVRGASPEQVLQAEERLRVGLDRLIAGDALGSYTAVSRGLPSQERQRQNRELLAQHVYAPDGALPTLLSRLGYANDAAARHREAFTAAQEPLMVNEWLASPASEKLRTLWLGDAGPGYASAVILSGVRDAAALRALAEARAGVRFVDRVASITAVMERYRRIAMACLAASYALIGVGLALRYGARDGLRLLSAPIAGAVLTLAVLGLAGIPVNLFNVLALLLVLGMGVDYAVFMQEGRATRSTVVMAILLAGLTTVLAFGMLSFSATPFIHGIGLTVVLGVSFTFAAALLCSAPGAGDNGRPPAPPAPA